MAHSEDGVYEVEKVLDHRRVNGRIYYLVKWCGFPHSDNTWEPEKNLGNCQEALKEYHNKPRLNKKRKEEHKSSSREVSKAKAIKIDLTQNSDDFDKRNNQAEIPMLRRTCRQTGISNIKRETASPSCRYHRDADAEKIVAANKFHGQIRFLVKWKHCKHVKVYPAHEANRKFPLLVIEFYESRIVWGDKGSKDTTFNQVPENRITTMDLL